MAGTIVKGWPQARGAKYESVVDHTGPASYTVVTTGDPVTGGDIVTAAEFGLKFLDYVEATGSEDGVYDVVPIVSALDPVPRTQVTLRWFPRAGSVEVAATTNLSAKHVRLCAVGG